MSRLGRRFRRSGLVLVLVCAGPVLLACLNWVDARRAHADSYAGLPRAQSQSLWPFTPAWFHVIDPPGFVLGYSEYRRNPLWVAYRLDEPIRDRSEPRPDQFTVDRWTLARVRPEDYRRAGYDRGHLAPNYAMSRFHGRAAQWASFRMSNIVPQRSRLNQKLWQRLEELEVDVYAALPGPLWVLSGPVFAGAVSTLPGKIAIPEAFFRIWVRENVAGEPQLLAFLVPQTVSGYEPLDRFLVSVDAIEAATGLDFFHRLSPDTERRLESTVQARAWDLARHARHPPRY